MEVLDAALKYGNLEKYQEDNIRNLKRQMVRILNMPGDEAVNQILTYMGYQDYLKKMGMNANKLETVKLIGSRVESPEKLLERLEELRTIIQEKVSKQNFDTWIKPIKIVAMEDKCVQLSVPNKFFKDWLMDNYLSMIKNTLQSVIGISVDIDFILSRDKEKKPEAAVLPFDQDRMEDLLISGKTMKEVSDDLGVSPSTLREYRHVIEQRDDITINPFLERIKDVMEDRDLSEQMTRSATRDSLGEAIDITEAELIDVT